jgi:TonB family protein
MPSLWVLLALLSLAGATSQNDGAEPPMLYSERGAKYSFREGVLEMQGGRGWLRTSRLHLDFVLGFEFRTTAPDTDMGVLVRSWTGKGGWPDRGYRIRLPTAAVADAASVFEARRQQVITVRQGTIITRPVNEWQSVEISAVGKHVTVGLNGAVVGVFEVETFGGHILLENRKGRVELRNFRILDRQIMYDSSDGLITFEQLQKAGGQVPRVARELKPSYTSEAMRRKAQGTVLLKAIVLEDGSVGPVGVVRSLDPDLDLSAIAALKAWKFKPGTLNGKQLPVLTEVEMTFSLR